MLYEVITRNKEPDAEDKFKEIAEAYAVLSDSKKRAQYDAGGFAGVAGFSAEDLFGGIDFGEIFGDAGFGFDFRITSYNVCYTKLLRMTGRRVRHRPVRTSILLAAA